ncbi:MAG: hypothetical protein ACR2QG_05340 [Gammaproteobacteria bacterium]
MRSLIDAPRASLYFTLMFLSGLIIFILAVAVVMQPAAQAVGQDRLSELVCLQLAFTPERATEVVLSFPQEARDAMGALLIPGDFMLAWGYGLQLAGLLGLLVLRLPQNWQRAGAIAIWIPLLASLLDCIENVFLYTIVTRLAEDIDTVIVPVITIMASSVATMKWICLSVLTPLFGFSGLAKAVMADRKAVSWLVYLLLGATLASMMIKPLQDIPACF